MKRFSYLIFLGLLSSLLLTGCFNATEPGPSLFDEDGNEITEDAAEDDTDAVEEFGFTVEGTQCIKQIHGGCVPYDYYLYENFNFGLPFSYPSNWIPVGAKSTEIKLTPPIDSGEEGDPTMLYAWRQAAMDTSYDIVKEKIVDAGTGLIGPYDVTWEIYEGTWNDRDVTAEWITLTYADDNSMDTNYVFFLLTETDHFESDQAAIKAAASSVLAWEE